MIKLQWLLISKFRRVKPGTLLKFNPGYNVLLGQNGTGKTTLLSLVSAVVSSNFSDFIDEEFELEYAFEIDKTKVRVLIRNEEIPSPLEAAPHSPQFFVEKRDAILRRAVAASRGLTFSSEFIFDSPISPSLTFSISGGSGVMVSGEKPSEEVSFTTGPMTAGLALDEVILFRALERWESHRSRLGGGLLTKDDLEGLVQRYNISMPLAGMDVRRFDESLGYFSSIGNEVVEIELLQTKEALMKEALMMVRGATVVASVAEELKKAARDEWGETRYVLSGERIPFIKKLTGLLGFRGAELVFEFERVSEDGRTEHLKSGSQRFFFSHEGGWKISDKHLSYGQKRMLAFMCYLERARDIAIVDELVNGLHHNWIQACMERLGRRQVFLTSQNPLLLDYLTFDSPEEVRSRFVLCRWEHDTKQMVWENMSQEAAEDFFASYKVGFQQVGELLQSKGLW